MFTLKLSRGNASLILSDVAGLRRTSRIIRSTGRRLGAYATPGFVGAVAGAGIAGCAGAEMGAAGGAGPPDRRPEGAAQPKVPPAIARPPPATTRLRNVLNLIPASSPVRSGPCSYSTNRGTARVHAQGGTTRRESSQGTARETGARDSNAIRRRG